MNDGVDVDRVAVCRRDGLFEDVVDAAVREVFG